MSAPVRRNLGAVLLAALFTLSPIVSPAAAPDFATDGAAWQVVNDGVMGGVSSSQVQSSLDGVLFSGTVRTEYSGGFASVRRAVEADAVAGEVSALALRVRGDGQRYRLTAYVRASGGGMQSYSYFAEFETAPDTVTEHSLDLAQFRATFRGRAVPDAPPLAWRAVAGLGLMLTKDGHRDGRGPFALMLLSLRPVP
jgi:monofunctional biosynthetic peptidoglycan transglycosylase